MRDYTKYDIWQDGLELTAKVYEITGSFPDEEKFGLISQMRRAAISIPSNFAEGSSRRTEKEFCRFIEIALGSSFELKTQVLIADRLKYLEAGKSDQVINAIDSLSKRLNGLRNKLR